MPAGKGISQLTQVSTVTDGDLFLITDDSTGASRRVSWPDLEASINNITLADNTTGAFTFAEGANNYITIDTTNGSEKTIFHQDIQVNQTLSLGASGAQFFAFNEDTVKVKYANWYSSNTRQYGQGQLWYEQWFGAIDDTAGAANRRIGFYLDTPSHGASDAAGGSGQHPNNDRMHIDLDGVFIRNDLVVNETLTVTGNTTLNGTLTLPDADITFQDNNGTYPTSGKGFYWDLNTDEARIYAIQSANDYIDLVFKVSDNTNNQNDRWVFWLDSYEGQSADSYPLTMSADNAWFFCDPSTTDGKPDTNDWKVIINSSGAIRQKAPSSVTPLDNGELVVEATNNTTLTFKLKGSDGVVRSGSLTLS